MYRIITLLVLLAMLSISMSKNAVYAQTEPETGNNEISLNSDYFKGIFTDTKDIVTSPLKWDKKNWLKASLVAGVTLGLFVFDEDINDWIQDNRHDDLSEFANRFGGKNIVPPLFLLYAAGYVSKNIKAQRTALLTIENVVITGIFTQLMKFSFHRHRPNSGDPPDVWDGPGFENDNLSFPSGHTSLAFSIATPIATEYNNVIVPPLAYGLASLVGWSRMNDNKHWASDVFMGAALGYFTGKAVCQLNSPDGDPRLSIQPVLFQDRSAVMLSYRF
ncbi:MAG: phosphatase PAP2 family protein [Nitrospiraceae bacterium]|nr:MAG: phosphatase PAP2 family protein [Nitrospiraceae bacterium]